MYRPTYLKVDLSALEYNYNYLKDIAKKTVIPVIKANAYGFGDVEIARKFEKMGIRLVAVSSLEEAVHLRNNNINMDILILGYVDYEDFDVIKKENLIILSVSLDYIKKGNFKDIRIHIKIDSGMGRIGVDNLEKAKEVLKTLQNQNASIEGIMTHFANSDIADEIFTKKQFSLFKSIVEGLNYDFKYVHCDNTDATINFKDDLSNAVRVGLGCYGFSSFDTKLKRIGSLYSKVINVKKVLKGTPIGYGSNYQALDNEYIATLPIGYADGFYRKNTGGMLYSKGKYYPVVGNVCMDQIMLRVDEDATMLQEFEIFGDHINPLIWAEKNDTIVYEIFTSLSDRIARIYIEDNKQIKEITPRFKTY